MSEAEVDVAVIGAGPVGVVLAQLLADSGVRTLVVDREPDVMRIPRAIALDDDGSRVLQAIGALPSAEGNMPRIERVRMRSPSAGDLFVFDANRFRNGHPMVRMFRQPELEDVLRAGLARRAHVELRTNTTLEALAEEPDAVRLHLRRDGTSRTVRARYVVGCDGARSSVRRMIGVELVGNTYERDWLVVDVRIDPTPNREVTFLCDPRRPGVTMPAPDGGRRWEFMLGEGDDRVSIASPESLRRLLSTWGDVDAMSVERSAVYTFHARVAERMQKGRVFLAGDAAHLTPPFAGQGLMAGLRDANNLAWKLAYAIRGEGGAALLQTYESERLPNAHTMVDLARLMGEVIMARDPVSCLVRDRVLAPVGRLLGLRSSLTSVELKPRTTIDRGLLLPGAVADVRAGELLPQGSVSDARGNVTRLDDRIGYRVAIVGVGVDPSSYMRRDQQAWLGTIGRRLAIGRGVAPRVVDPDVVSLVDLDDALVGRVPTGTCLVARPDRHLYAVVRPGELEAALDRFRLELGTGAAVEPRSLRAG